MVSRTVHRIRIAWRVGGISFLWAAVRGWNRGTMISWTCWTVLQHIWTLMRRIFWRAGWMLVRTISWRRNLICRTQNLMIISFLSHKWLWTHHSRTLLCSSEFLYSIDRTDTLIELLLQRSKSSLHWCFKSLVWSLHCIYIIDRSLVSTNMTRSVGLDILLLLFHLIGGAS